MISLPAGTPIWLAAGVTDMRSVFNGLASKYKRLARKIRTAAMYSCSADDTDDLIKVLWWPGDGLCLLCKRLERRRFIWPQASSDSVTLTHVHLLMLLEGIDRRPPACTWQPESTLKTCRGPRELGRMLNAVDLPDDIAALKAMLLASEVRAARIQAHAEQNEACLAHLTAELSRRNAEIEHLKLVLAKLRRIQFSRKPEKLVPAHRATGAPA